MLSLRNSSPDDWFENSTAALWRTFIFRFIQQIFQAVFSEYNHLFPIYIHSICFHLFAPSANWLQPDSSVVPAAIFSSAKFAAATLEASAAAAMLREASRSRRCSGWWRIKAAKTSSR
jgi:hypothetical protein